MTANISQQIKLARWVEDGGAVYTAAMSNVKTASSVENIIDEMRQLSQHEQRALAAAVLEDRKLEAFVEELEDHLSCERASTEGPTELFLS